MNAPQSTALASVQIPSLTMNEDELLKVLESSIYPGGKLESIKLALGYCRSQQLDPLQKPVHIVPMSVKKAGTKDQYEWRDVIMPGIGLYRTIAARTGEYAGCSAPQFGPVQTLKVGEFQMEYPESCQITVRRIVQGQVVEFTALEYWIENYATKGRDSDVPNAMWQKRPWAQLAKCAEAQALRKGFPEVGAAPTADEMAGKTLDDDSGLTIDSTAKRIEVQQPTSKSAAKAPADPKPAPPKDATEGETLKPITQGAVKTIEKAMERAGLSLLDIKAKFGMDADGVIIEGWDLTHLTLPGGFNAVMEFIKTRTTQ